MTDSDRERKIISECKSGQSEAFSKLYDLYVEKIYKFIYYKTFHTQTAEDLTSEVFYKALKNIDKFNPKYRFSTWIYKIAQNAITDYFRTYKKTINIEDVWDLADDADLIKQVDDKINFNKIKKHLNQLAAIQRDIIIMRLWQDLSYDEISEITGKSAENCRVIFSRSISSLRLKILLIVLLLLNISINI